jgi:hypothetical protein
LSTTAGSAGVHDGERARLNRDFRDLPAAFLETGVRFLIVGAYAMAVHGVPRATGHLDVWIAPDPENADRAWSALLAFGARWA